MDGRLHRGFDGWAIGDDSESSKGKDAAVLHDKLENSVLPLYYQARRSWLRGTEGAIAKNVSCFNSHRMVRRYVGEAYIH